MSGEEILDGCRGGGPIRGAELPAGGDISAAGFAPNRFDGDATVGVDRAALETLGLVHEHEFVIILRAKSAGFSNLRSTRIESTSADCSARLADYTNTEGVGVVQKRE